MQYVFSSKFKWKHLSSLEIYYMATKSRGFYWLMFFASIALSVVVYLFLPSMTSLTVVPLVSFLAKALDLI
jgi:hypothetical protein